VIYLNKTILYILIFVLFLFSVTALSVSKEISINDFDSVYIPCDGELGCNSSVECNITTIDANENILFNQSNMTRSGDLFSIPVNSSNVSFGLYDHYIICCSLNGDCDSSRFLWDIVPDNTSAVFLIECPDTIPGHMTLWLMFAVVIFLMIIAFVALNGWIGIIASFLLGTFGIIIWTCSPFIGIAILISAGSLLMYWMAQSIF